MTAIVVLAAGASSRLGVPKGLYPMPDGRPWLLWQLDALRLIEHEATTIVLGIDAERTRAILPGDVAEALTVAINPAPERGPFSSLQCGLGVAPPRATFVLPIDVPAAPPDVWRALAATRADAAVPTLAERGGHPVYLSETVVRQVMTLAPSARLDETLAALGSAVARVPVDAPCVRMNLNAPEDFAAYLRR